MSWWRNLVPGGQAPELVPYMDALEALGRDGRLGRRLDDVPVTSIVGSLHRHQDFDREFRLLNPALRERWERLADAMRDGVVLPPVDLVQLGELYFVLDGHHRVSIARSMGQLAITARVDHLCTVAYARACLRVAHLPTKAAERRFLERVPLPQPVRQRLWLDLPAQWARLADAAEAWGLRRTLEHDRHLDRCELAASWWAEEVEPLVDRMRGAGLGGDLEDVQLYVTALAVRDHLGSIAWPDDVIDRLHGQPRLTRTPKPVPRRARFGAGRERGRESAARNARSGPPWGR